MVNQVNILGNLGKDPEMKEVNGTNVTKFSVATTEKWKSKDGEAQERTEWHNVVVWGGQAPACNQYLSKGSKVFVSGAINYRQYQNDAGETKYITEIRAKDVRFLNSKSDGPSTTKAAPAVQPNEQDDIPF